MGYTDLTLKKLFVLSGNVCAFPGCNAPIFDTEHGVVTGEICHIKGKSPQGAGHDPQQSASERDSYENLMLMCGAHNKIIDDPATRDGFTDEMLLGYKHDHESRFPNTVVKEDVLSYFVEALSRLTPHKVVLPSVAPIVESFMTGADNQMGIDYYDFRIKLRNDGESTVRESRLEVEIPKAYASSPTISAAEVKEHTRGNVKLYRRTQNELGPFTLYPGETSDYVLTLDYQIKHDQYKNVTESIKLILFSGDTRISSTEYAITEYLNRDRLDQLGLSTQPVNL